MNAVDAVPLTDEQQRLLDECKRRVLTLIGALDLVRCEAYSIAHQYGLALQSNNAAKAFDRVNPLPERIDALRIRVRDLNDWVERPWP